MLMVRFRRSMEANADLTAYLQGTISGVSLIRAHGEEGPVTERFQLRNREIFDANWSLAKVRAILFPLMIVSLSIGAMVTLLVGGRAVVQEKLISPPLSPSQRISTCWHNRRFRWAGSLLSSPSSHS